MRPDAMASSFFSRMAKQDRMDRTQAGEKHSHAQGSGSAGNDKTGFKTVYVQVAKSNEQAAKVADPVVCGQAPLESAEERLSGELLLQELPGQETDQLSDPVLPVEATGEIELDNLALQQALMQFPGLIIPPEGQNIVLPGDQDLTILEQVLPSQLLQTPAATNTAEASLVISQALTEISEALHLTIDPGLKNLSLSGNAGDLSGQFSEILYTLKQIVQVLEAAVAKGQTIALGKNGVIDVPQAREMASFIQVRLFSVEIGISMLGIADKVQADLAQKLSLPQTGGIPQALDPQSISMPQAQIEKVFGEFFKESSSNMATLVQKMRELCARSGQGGSAGAAVKVVEVNATLTETVKTVTVPGHAPFDSKVFRKLLNIEAKELLAAQNAEAANQAVKVHLTPGTANSLLQNADIGALKTADELLPVGDASGKVQMTQLLAGLETKSALASYRTTDENVMTQIAERLQGAIRSGLTEIRLMLRPESLGEVRMRIRVEGDVVFARIHVESQMVKQIVESNMQSLKDSLQQQQLSCGSLEVSVGNEGWNDNDGKVNKHHGAMTARSSGANGNGSESDMESSEVALGTETGRRFGGNTVEYFA
jgi:flagellar hook-length control protein FliK